MSENKTKQNKPAFSLACPIPFCGTKQPRSQTSNSSSSCNQNKKAPINTLMTIITVDISKEEEDTFASSSSSRRSIVASVKDKLFQASSLMEEKHNDNGKDDDDDNNKGNDLLRLPYKTSQKKKKEMISPPPPTPQQHHQQHQQHNQKHRRSFLQKELSNNSLNSFQSIGSHHSSSQQQSKGGGKNGNGKLLQKIELFESLSNLSYQHHPLDGDNHSATSGRGSQEDHQIHFEFEPDDDDDDDSSFNFGPQQKYMMGTGGGGTTSRRGSGTSSSTKQQQQKQQQQQQRRGSNGSSSMLGDKIKLFESSCNSLLSLPSPHKSPASHSKKFGTSTTTFSTSLSGGGHNSISCSSGGSSEASIDLLFEEDDDDEEEEPNLLPISPIPSSQKNRMNTTTTAAMIIAPNSCKGPRRQRVQLGGGGNGYYPTKQRRQQQQHNFFNASLPALFADDDDQSLDDEKEKDSKLLQEQFQSSIVQQLVIQYKETTEKESKKKIQNWTKPPPPPPPPPLSPMERWKQAVKLSTLSSSNHRHQHQHQQQQQQNNKDIVGNKSSSQVGNKNNNSNNSNKNNNISSSKNPQLPLPPPPLSQEKVKVENRWQQVISESINQVKETNNSNEYEHNNSKDQEEWKMNKDALEKFKQADSIQAQTQIQPHQRQRQRRRETLLQKQKQQQQQQKNSDTSNNSQPSQQQQQQQQKPLLLRNAIWSQLCAPSLTKEFIQSFQPPIHIKTKPQETIITKAMSTTVVFQGLIKKFQQQQNQNQNQPPQQSQKQPPSLLPVAVPKNPKKKEQEELIQKAMSDNVIFSKLASSSSSSSTADGGGDDNKTSSSNKQQSNHRVTTLIQAMEQIEVEHGTVLVEQGGSSSGGGSGKKGRSRLSTSNTTTTITATGQQQRELPTQEHFYIVESGQVEFQIDGKIVGTAGIGQSFGEEQLLFNAQPRASVLASSTNHEVTKLFRIDSQTYRGIMQTTATTKAMEEEEKVYDPLEDVKEEDDDEEEKDDYAWLQEHSGIMEHRRAVHRAVQSTIGFDDLERVTVLGEGQFGEVWLVQTNLTVVASSAEDDNETLPKKKTYSFALKRQCKHDFERCEDTELYIRREMDMLRDLQHPFICDLVHHYEDTDSIYMVLGVVTGGELWDLIHNNPMNDDGDGEESFSSGLPGGEDQAKFYALVLADTLGYMHSKRYVFRDLKPENVMMDGDGYPVLVDFGFAKPLSHFDGELSKTYTFCGTPNYVAPEIVQNLGHNWGADHWALGVLIYEMLSGENPFYEEGMETMELFRTICETPYYPFKPEHNRSAHVVNLLDGLLAKDPNQRFGSRAKGGWSRDIVTHAWFDGLDLNQLRRKAVTAPWVPESSKEEEEEEAIPVAEPPQEEVHPVVVGTTPSTTEDNTDTSGSTDSLPSENNEKSNPPAIESIASEVKPKSKARMFINGKVFVPRVATALPRLDDSDESEEELLPTVPPLITKTTENNLHSNLESSGPRASYIDESMSTTASAAEKEAEESGSIVQESSVATRPNEVEHQQINNSSENGSLGDLSLNGKSDDPVLQGVSDQTEKDQTKDPNMSPKSKKTIKRKTGKSKDKEKVKEKEKRKSGKPKDSSSKRKSGKPKDKEKVKHKEHDANKEGDNREVEEVNPITATIEEDKGDSKNTPDGDHTHDDYPKSLKKTKSKTKSSSNKDKDKVKRKSGKRSTTSKKKTGSSLSMSMSNLLDDDLPAVEGADDSKSISKNRVQSSSMSDLLNEDLPDRAAGVEAKPSSMVSPVVSDVAAVNNSP